MLAKQQQRLLYYLYRNGMKNYVQKEDYPIFFATMQESSKDSSGDKIYVLNEDGTPKLDTRTSNHQA